MSVDALSMRPPQQQRSRATLDRVLAAGAVVLAEHGYEGFTIAEVARRGQTSIGAIYTRFEGKDAIVHAVHDAVMNRLVAESLELYAPSPAWDGLATPALVEKVAATLLEHFRSHAPILRALIRRAAVDAVLRSKGASSMRTTANAFVERLLDRAADYPHENPGSAAWTAFALTYESVAWDIAFGADFRAVGSLPVEDLDVRLPGIVRRYLLTAPGHDS